MDERIQERFIMEDENNIRCELFKCRSSQVHIITYVILPNIKNRNTSEPSSLFMTTLFLQISVYSSKQTYSSYGIKVKIPYIIIIFSK